MKKLSYTLIALGGFGILCTMGNSDLNTISMADILYNLMLSIAIISLGGCIKILGGK